VINRVELLELDQCDEKAMHRVVDGFDTIFNMVGQVNHVDSMENPYLDLHTNVTAHVSLLEACRKYSPKAKILFAGTRGQYGRPNVSPWTRARRSRPSTSTASTSTPARPTTSSIRACTAARELAAPDQHLRARATP
jgi:UDP-glucose 4-epimerase